MSAPLGLDIKSNINEMTVGCCIPCRYTALTSGVPGYFYELGTCTADEIPVTGTATPDGKFYFNMVEPTLLIADRVIQTNISWDALNNIKYIEGSQLITQIDNSIITALSDKSGYGTTSPQKLFNNILTNDSSNEGFYINTGTLPHYIGFFLSIPKTLAKIRYYTYGSGNYQPYTFTIEGSNDATNPTNGNWIELASFTNYPSILGNTWGEYIVNNYTSYSAYRIKITATNRGLDIQFLLNELQLMEYITPFLLIRSLSGGCAYADVSGNSSLTDQNLGVWPVNNEWDKYIVKSDLGGKITPGDDNIWHWNSLYSWGKDTPINNTVNSDGVKATNTSRCVRGSINSKQYAFGSGSYGFRPVLQLKHPKQQNLWY